MDSTLDSSKRKLFGIGPWAPSRTPEERGEQAVAFSLSVRKDRGGRRWPKFSRRQRSTKIALVLS